MNFYEYTDPVLNSTMHLVGFEATIEGGGHPIWNGYYKGAMFARRDINGQYALEEINGTITKNDTALVAARCYVSSPFQNEKAIYFGGFDPNRFVSTNKAWVFKKHYEVNFCSRIINVFTTFYAFSQPCQYYAAY